jgi:hypothetical protein
MMRRIKMMMMSAAVEPPPPSSLYYSSYSSFSFSDSLSTGTTGVLSFDD